MFKQYYFNDIKQRAIENFDCDQSTHQGIKDAFQDREDLIEMVEDLLKEDARLREQIKLLYQEINDID